MKKQFISIGAAAAMLSAVYVPAVHAETLGAAQKGKILQFGTYAGQPINYVIGGSRDVNGDGEEELFLYSKNFVSFREYAADGVSDWKTSSLRTWLNSDRETVAYTGTAPTYANQPGYLIGLSENEKRLIVPEEHKTLINNALNPDGGSNTIGWNDRWPGVLDSAVGDLDVNTAYYRLTSDYVFIPSLLDMRDYGILPRSGFNGYEKACMDVYGETVTGNGYGWIRDGSTKTASRMWYANDSVSAAEVKNSLGVRPCMYIQPGAEVVGSGTESDPYSIAFPFEAGRTALSQDGAEISALSDGEILIQAEYTARNAGEKITFYAVRYETADGKVRMADCKQQELTAEGGSDTVSVSMKIENAEKSCLKVFFCGEDGAAKAAPSVFGNAPAGSAVSEDREDSFWMAESVENFDVSILGKETSSPFATVNVRISSQDQILYLDAKTPDQNGGFDFSFAADESAGGWYDVTVSSTCSKNPLTGKIGIAGKELYQNTLKSFSDLDAETIAKILSGDAEYSLEHNSMLGKGLYLEDLTTAELSKLAAEALKKNLPEQGFTPENFPETFNRIVAGILFDQSDDPYAVLENEKYSGILKSADVIKKTAYAMVKKNQADLGLTSETVSEKLLETVILKALALSENAGDAKAIVEESTEAIGITLGSTYKNLSSSQQKKLYDQLVGAAFSDLAALKSKWQSALSLVQEYTGGGGGSSSGGGSKKNSSSSSYIPVTAPDKIQKEPQPDPEKITFSDVTNLTWGKTEILSLAQKGILSGMEKDLFEPDGSVTREQFAKMAAGAFGLSDPKKSIGFTDVLEDAWYAGSIRAMAEAGFISGVSEDRFGVGEKITRQDLAVILYRILKDRLSDGAELQFTDADDISDYAKDACRVLSANKILSGYEDGSFGAKREVTRREAAVLLYKALNL